MLINRLHTDARPSGVVHNFNAHRNDLVEADTKHCCHCGHHFKIQSGSGKIRGWCTKCSSITCGAHECDVCYPFEQKLEDYEKKRIGTLL